MHVLTAIITVSFIPSHPKIKLIQDTIESLQLINKRASAPEEKVKIKSF